MPNSSDLIAKGYEARRAGNLDEAERFFSSVARSSEAPKVALGQSLMGLGQVERDRRNLPSALDYYEQAVTVYRSLPEPLTLAHAVRHEGDVLRALGSAGEARRRYDESLAIYRQHAQANPLDVANALRGFALLNEELNEVPEALRLWREAKTLYDLAGVEAGSRESAARVARLSSR